ncbi:MAG: hypothetical protein IIB71_13190, partial [Proteobacteria bacterium]|nr:hypothetical protein [Pseudomonadota bacterium]
MIQGSVPKIVSMLMLILSVVACGGGSGGGETLLGGGATGSTPSTPVPVVDLFLRAPDGVTNITSINGSETGRLIAQVLDQEGGSPVSGIVVTFTSDLGQISPESGTALTDDSGFAEVSLGAGTTAGAGSAFASAVVNNSTISSSGIGFDTDGLGSGVGSVNFLVEPILLTTPNGSFTVSRDNEGSVSVTVTNGDGTPLTQDALVEFATTVGTLAESAVFTINGVATTILRAGTVSGSGSLSALISIGSETLSPDPLLFISAGDSVATIILSVPGGASPSARASTPVDGSIDATNPVVVTATVTDSLGTLSQGSVVQFSLSGDGRLSKTSDITNVSGVATTIILAGTIQGFGQISATATVDGVSVVTDNSNLVTFVTDGDEPFTGEGNSNLTIVIGLDTNGDQADAGENAIDADLPGVLFATVTQADGSPLADMVVQFSLNGGVGDLFPLNGLALTDLNGIASAALTAGSVPGAGTATATIIIDGATFNDDSFTFSSLGNAGDAVIVVELLFNGAPPGDSNIITTSKPATISILVEDDSGANLPNRSTIVTTSLGTVSIGGSTPAATATAITNSSGQIEVVLAAGTTFGTGTVSVTVGETTEIVQFDVGVDGLQIGTCSGGGGAGDATDCSSPATFTSGTLAISTTPLSAGGTSTVSLVVVDASQVVVPNVDISFTTVCAGKDPSEASIS